MERITGERPICGNPNRTDRLETGCRTIIGCRHCVHSERPIDSSRARKRKREWMGIEPTKRLCRRFAGFEDRGGHQIRVHSPEGEIQRDDCHGFDDPGQSGGSIRNGAYLRKLVSAQATVPSRQPLPPGARRSGFPYRTDRLETGCRTIIGCRHCVHSERPIDSSRARKRKREWMGIEPTKRLCRRFAGFEDRGGHQIRVHSPEGEIQRDDCHGFDDPGQSGGSIRNGAYLRKLVSAQATVPSRMLPPD